MFEELIKKHNLMTKLVVVENNCLASFDAYLSSIGIKGKRCLICDSNTDIFSSKIKYDSKIVLNAEGLHANESGIKAIEEKIDKSADVLISLGGGTIADLTRYCAHKLNKVFICCPTIASVDGFVSSVAALTIDGYKKTFEAVAPIAVIADLDIISRAPIRYALSGYGDMLAKYVCLLDWKISNLVIDEPINDDVIELENKSLKEVEESISKISSNDINAYKNLMEGLLLSGIAMQIVGSSRPASGAEHHFAHLLEVSPKESGYHSDLMHGERVAIGTIYILKNYKNLSNLNCPKFNQININYDEISNIFGTHLSVKMKEENQNNILNKVDIVKLTSSWKKIQDILKNVVDPINIENKCKQLGMKYSLESIGIDKKRLPLIYKTSPLIRNRLTLQRISLLIKS